MNKAAFTEDELRRAALQVHEAMMAALEPIEEHEFSFEFHRKMAILRRKMKLRHGIRKAAKSVAAIFLAMLIGGSVLLTANQNVRATFLAWAQRIYEQSVFYQYVDEENAGDLPHIRPAWIPKGYVEVIAAGDNYTQSVMYQKEDDMSDIIVFVYSRSYENKHTNLQSDSGFDHKIVNINGYQADLYVPHNDTVEKELVWFDDINNIAYGISYFGADKDILRMAKSIYKKE
ncbi:MAG: DUF4367 domain-containing protein [Oscillospiraceae bacterium]|nr:DUF4367 domain-containing protein [Oscillospiraceae bacterium]